MRFFKKKKVKKAARLRLLIVGFLLGKNTIIH